MYHSERISEYDDVFVIPEGVNVVEIHAYAGATLDEGYFDFCLTNKENGKTTGWLDTNYEKWIDVYVAVKPGSVLKFDYHGSGFDEYAYVGYSKSINAMTPNYDLR